MVRAGLQRHIGRGSTHIVAFGCSIAQSHHLGVRATGLLGKALADDALRSIDDHAANARVG